MDCLEKDSMPGLEPESVMLTEDLQTARFLPALRAGLDLEVLPAVYLDLNANYRFEQWGFDNITNHISTDTVTLGAIVRLEF